MSYHVSPDLAWDMSLQSFLSLLEKHQAKLVNFISHGPGGGNPNVTLSFPSQEIAENFMIEIWPDDEIGWIRQQIKKL